MGKMNTKPKSHKRASIRWLLTIFKRRATSRKKANSTAEGERQPIVISIKTNILSTEKQAEIVAPVFAKQRDNPREQKPHIFLNCKVPAQPGT